MPMHSDELLMGDVIFSISPRSEAEHTSMYIGRIGKYDYIAHEVTSRTNPGLKLSVLKPHGKFENYEVFRLNNQALAIDAATQMQTWCDYLVPYDQQRAGMVKKIKNLPMYSQYQDSARKFAEFHQSCAENNFYQRIKFATRRDTSPVHIREDGSSRGLRCSQVIALAYQVSEIKDYVKTYDELGKRWVSDKHCFDSVCEQYNPSSSYLNYQEQIRNKEEYEIYTAEKKDAQPNENYIPSLAAWRYDKAPVIEDFAKTLDSCMPVDAKVIDSESLRESLRKTSQHWQSFNGLKVEPVFFTETEKQAYREKEKEKASRAEELRRGVRVR